MQMLIQKNDITTTKIAPMPKVEPGAGEIRVRIDRFGYSANNVTYAAAGDTLGYWKFFPTQDPDWGLVPVWGFADVDKSNCEGIGPGERLFGYFPPATHLILRPTDANSASFMDATPHRSALPSGYNFYRRVEKQEQDVEDRHMLLSPLYLTSWCLWDAMKQSDWFGAEQIILVSASSKTAIGTAFALAQDETSPTVIGMTSQRNLDFVNGLNLYDSAISYDHWQDLDREKAAVLVDMSGDATMMGRLHSHLGERMRQTLDVGLTHWAAPRRDEARIKQRSQFFFAPSHIQARIKEWGAKQFGERTQKFMTSATADSQRWLVLNRSSGLETLEKLHTEIAAGKSDPSEGFVIKV